MISINNKIQNLTLSRVFMFALIVFITGIFLSEYVQFFNDTYYIILFSIFALALIAIFWVRFYIIKFTAIMLIIFFMATGYYGIFISKVVPRNLPYDQNVEFEGVIYREPDIRDRNIKLKIKVLEVSKVSEASPLGNTQSKKAFEYDTLSTKNILVTVPRYPEYNYGDRVKITGKLEKPEKIENFDYEKYLYPELIFALIKNPAKVELISHNNGSKIFEWIYKIKNKFIETINKILAEPFAALLSGILVGARRSIPENLMDIFNIVGITHIIAISGYNVTIVVKMFQSVSRHWSKLLAFILGIIGLASFVILTGASASVMRAAILASLFLIARQLGRKGDISVATIFVGFVMIIINPFILRYDISFQLSFLAVIGLIYVSPLFDKLLVKLDNFFRDPFSATLGAQVMTLPIIIVNFERLSLISPIANVLILPLVPLIMIIGFFSAVVGMIFLPLGQIFGWSVWLLLKYVIVISTFLSKIPFASLQIKLNNTFVMIILYIMIYLMVKSFKIILKHRKIS